MLLKRNIRQVSVLHVYHHCSVPVIWWLITYHAPGGEGKIAFAVQARDLQLDQSFLIFTEVHRTRFGYLASEDGNVLYKCSVTDAFLLQPLRGLGIHDSVLVTGALLDIRNGTP
jgi:hypothetical protein